ncbi:MAG TPA: S1C family serine protease [Polyangiaceae bacterium]|nr:S1C family serine protease [Polyangiaceae bacterium]
MSLAISTTAVAQPLLTARPPTPSPEKPQGSEGGKPSPASGASGSASAATPASPPPVEAPPSTPKATAQPEGIVLVERAGRTIALGSVLAVDGRVLSSWSRVTGDGPLTLRYSDGSQEPARVGHFDAAQDLALLVPETRRWQRGLTALRGFPPAGVALTTFALAPNRTLLAVGQHTTLVQENGRWLLKLSQAVKPEAWGGPLLDAQGKSAGLVVSCGNDTPNCAVVRPVDELRAFLKTLPVTAGFALPRLGLAGRAIDTGTVRGLLLSSIEPDGPAAALKLRTGETTADGDVLVAVGGAPVPTPNELRAALARHRAGSKVELLVFSKGEYRTVPVQLAAYKKPVTR